MSKSGGSGELVRIYNNAGTLIDQVLYDDADPWPTGPDGNGPTLELIHPSLDNAQAQSWMSSPDHGTPGQKNSVWVDVVEKEKLVIKMNVVPNPVRDKAFITFGGESLVVDGVLTVLNTMGELIESIDVSKQTSITLDMQHYPPGVYLLRFNDSQNRVAIQRVVR